MHGATVKLGHALVLGLLALHCAAPEPEPDESYGREVGKGCGDARSECLDAERLWGCIDRRWELIECAEACAGRGGAVGCLATASLADGARCWCEDDAPACAPMQRACASSTELEWCDPETLQLTRASCDELCASLAPPHLSEGCASGRCKCTLDATPCAAGTPTHCEGSKLAECVDGLWRIEECWSRCDGAGTCDPWRAGGATCDCGA